MREDYCFSQNKQAIKRVCYGSIRSKWQQNESHKVVYTYRQWRHVTATLVDGITENRVSMVQKYTKFSGTVLSQDKMRSTQEIKCISELFSSVQSLSPVQLFATPWITARQASLSITNSRSLLKLMPMESVMPSSHLSYSSTSPVLFIQGKQEDTELILKGSLLLLYLQDATRVRGNWHLISLNSRILLNSLT